MEVSLKQHRKQACFILVLKSWTLTYEYFMLKI